MAMHPSISKTLVCSECAKFLSVPPIKVYPNRQVKCGRCSKDDDWGVESRLYKTMAKSILFPCINSYDGCSELRTIKNMLGHEENCKSNEYDCFICANYKGMAFQLDAHCKEQHKTETLDNLEFSINRSTSYHTFRYFYSNLRRLFFIKGSFDPEWSNLQVNLIFMGKHHKGLLNYSLKLYSIKNKNIYESTVIPCGVMGLKNEEIINVNFKDVRRKENIIICKLFVHEDPVLEINRTPSVIHLYDPDQGYYTLNCPFDKVVDTFTAEIDPNYFMYFPAAYYFKGITWTIALKKENSLTGYRTNLAIYLIWEDTDVDVIESCQVSAVFTVVAEDPMLSIWRTITNRSVLRKAHTFTLIHDWDFIMDPDHSFYNDNRLMVAIKFKIHSINMRVPRWKHCRRACTL